MRVDWHQDIGYGFIDSQGLREVAKIAKDLGKPLILETPCEKEDYNEQIEKVKFWTR